MVDTSALLALLQNEEQAPALRKALSEDLVRLISTVSVLEASCVVGSRRGPAATVLLTPWLKPRANPSYLWATISPRRTSTLFATRKEVENDHGRGRRGGRPDVSTNRPAAPRSIPYPQQDLWESTHSLCIDLFEKSNPISMASCRCR